VVTGLLSNLSLANAINIRDEASRIAFRIIDINEIWAFFLSFRITSCWTSDVR